MDGFGNRLILFLPPRSPIPIPDPANRSAAICSGHQSDQEDDDGKEQEDDGAVGVAREHEVRDSRKPRLAPAKATTLIRATILSGLKMAISLERIHH